MLLVRNLILVTLNWIVLFQKISNTSTMDGLLVEPTKVKGKVKSHTSQGDTHSLSLSPGLCDMTQLRVLLHPPG